jgi:diguanylate cyclase (GGDEF)-like protein
MRFTDSSIEYVAVIVNAEGEDLMTAENRSRALVEQSSIPYDEGIRVTISLGATLARKDDTIDSLIRRADQLMYRSKQAGRNRVIADL